MDVLHLDSITDADARAAGQIVASGSHGGLYPAAVASVAGVRAVAFNDAGIGYQDAGVAGVVALSSVGMAAVGVDCRSCHIGDARDLAQRGIVSVANDIAAACGIEPGMAMPEAFARLAHAPFPTGQLPHVAEARSQKTLKSGMTVELLDSASLVVPGDQGRIVITGSHGGLIGGDPARALKAAARIAVFNDAGIGCDGIGVTRLPALESRGVAAATIRANSARIGDAASALQSGVISYANTLAKENGAEPGRALADWLNALQA